MSAGRVARLGVAAALYVALTVALGPLSYGAVQVRFAAGLMALAALDPWMIAAVALGTAVANLFGGLGPQDVVLGAAVTAATCGACWLLRRNRVATLAAIPLVSAPLLALYLHALFRLPFAVTAAWLAVG